MGRAVRRTKARSDGLRQQLLAEYRALVPASLPFQQVVAEVTAQSPQGGGHRGLAHPDPLACPGQVPVLKERAEREEQVEVDLQVFGHGTSLHHHHPWWCADHRQGRREGNNAATGR